MGQRAERNDCVRHEGDPQLHQLPELLRSFGPFDLWIVGQPSGIWKLLRPFRSGLSWTPYMNGQWILDPRLGWIWVSNEPWGWMPYHFGTWLLSPTLGWV